VEVAIATAAIKTALRENILISRTSVCGVMRAQAFARRIDRFEREVSPRPW
jgi:hypothetical protein